MSGYFPGSISLIDQLDSEWCRVYARGIHVRTHEVSMCV